MSARQLALLGETSGAIFSACERYRYRLWRRWGRGPHVLWCMLNPSTAHETAEDPTIRRCLGFSRAWGYGGAEIVNMFALRSTDPDGLRAVDDPVGPENDRHIADAAARAELVIAAWGAYPLAAERARVVLPLLGPRVLCLGRTAGGQPRHPLYLRGSTRPEP